MKSINDPSEDADIINQSFIKPKKFENIIRVIAHRSNSHRQQIVQAYNYKYQKNLISELNNELSGNFKEAVLALFYHPVDLDCHQLRTAMKGLGTNEDTLIEILSSRSNERINQIKQRYQQLYNKNLIKDVESDTSGLFRKILLALLEANRPNNPNPDPQLCNDCAKRMYEAQIHKKENLHDIFIYTLTQKSREELALIAKIYYDWYSKTLFEVIESLFSSDAKKAMKAIIYSLLSPSEYFAYRINKALKGLGTNDHLLIRVLVSRDEIDIERIKRYYKQLYKTTLYDAVKKDTSGDYQTLLLELIGK